MADKFAYFATHFLQELHVIVVRTAHSIINISLGKNNYLLNVIILNYWSRPRFAYFLVCFLFSKTYCITTFPLTIQSSSPPKP